MFSIARIVRNIMRGEEEEIAVSKVSYLNLEKTEFVINGTKLSINLLQNFYLSIRKQTENLVENSMLTYISKVDELLEILLVITHISSGQPTRGTELETLTIQNHLSQRNIYYFRGFFFHFPFPFPSFFFLNLI